MIHNIYSVKDVMTNTFIGFSMFKTNQEAQRQFKTQINDIPLWRDNPQDFDLWRLGRYNDENGELTPDMELVAHGRSVKE